MKGWCRDRDLLALVQGCIIPEKSILAETVDRVYPDSFWTETSLRLRCCSPLILGLSFPDATYGTPDDSYYS